MSKTAINPEFAMDDEAASNRARLERTEAALQAARPERNHHFTDVARDVETAYAAAREAQPELTQAFAQIAAWFYEPNDEGDVDHPSYDPNAFGFQQRGVLGNICNNAVYQHDAQEKRLARATENLRAQKARFNGDEISTGKLQAAVAWFKQDRLKLAMLADWVTVTTAAYEGVTGEVWKPYSKAGPDAKAQSVAALLAEVDDLI